MPFTVNQLANQNFEVLMEPNTTFRGKLRRIAYCTHQNDAEHIAECLNRCEDADKAWRTPNEYYEG